MQISDLTNSERLHITMLLRCINRQQLSGFKAELLLAKIDKCVIETWSLINNSSALLSPAKTPNPYVHACFKAATPLLIKQTGIK